MIDLLFPRLTPCVCTAPKERRWERGVYAASTRDCQQATDCPNALLLAMLKRREHRGLLSAATPWLTFMVRFQKLICVPKRQRMNYVNAVEGKALVLRPFAISPRLPFEP